MIRRAEQAARGGKVEYGSRLINPRYRFRTETIIELLGITEEEMRACGFRHLVSPERKRELRREAKVQSRRASGVRSRDTYEAESLTKAKPWETEGVSRATWYRRRETSLSRCMVV